MFYVSDKTIIEVNYTYYTALKVSKYGVFSGPNTGKYEPEKTPYFEHIITQQKLMFLFNRAICQFQYFREFFSCVIYQKL